MFIHNFKYTLKTLFKNKSLIFWTFAFPIILGTLFNMAFKDITKNEKLTTIDIAVINNEEFNKNEIYKEALKELSEKENKIFNTTYTTKEEAKTLLEEKKIKAYIEIENENTKITCKENGIDQTIIKYVTEEIEQKSTIIKNLSKQEIENEIKAGNYNIDYNKINNEILEIINNKANIKNISNNNLDYVMIEFYTLIAMTCLYGGMLGMYSINQKLPNMCNIGKRISVSPLKKKTIILSSLLASYLTQLIGLLLLFIYTIFIIKVDYGNNILLVILLSLVGSLTGLALGLVIGTIIKSKENTKIGILLGITMFGCFLSGMMGISMKYIIDKNIPIINKINPAALITDGFYSLYYYDTLNRYWFNIISLTIISLILILISINSLRRQKYDNI
jgi:ABC-2 type transport system permease protein